jgi:RNA polymerase sigma factor for flagellar operon FliA
MLTEAIKKMDSGMKQVIRDDLIVENLSQVKWIANRMAGHFASSTDMDDLVGAGVLGLIDAAERYEPSRDNKFMTYAMFRIRGSILSELRSRDFVSRTTRKKIRNLEEAYTRLEHDSDQEVSDEQIANELDLDIEKLHEIKRLASFSFVSLEELDGPHSKKKKETILNQLISGGSDDALNFASFREVASALAQAIEQLPEKEKLVVSMYYWDELTMKEIGKVLDITESRVSQIHSKALIHLRNKLRQKDCLDY